MFKISNNLLINIRSLMQVPYSTEQSTICVEIEFLYKGVSWLTYPTQYQLDCFLCQLSLKYYTRGNPALSIHEPMFMSSLPQLQPKRNLETENNKSKSNSVQLICNINKRISAYGCIFYTQTKYLHEYHLSEFINPPKELYDSMKNQFVGTCEISENLDLPFPKNEKERKLISFVKNLNSKTKNNDLLMDGFLKSILPITQEVRVEIMSTFLFGYKNLFGGGDGLLSLIKPNSKYKLQALEIISKLLNYTNNVNVLDICNIIYFSDIKNVGISLDNFYESGVPSVIENVNNICYMLWLESKAQFSFKIFFEVENYYENVHAVIRKRTESDNNRYSFNPTL